MVRGLKGRAGRAGSVRLVGLLAAVLEDSFNPSTIINNVSI